MMLQFFYHRSPPYHQVLLQTAQKMITDKEYAIAIVVAHMACEVVTEQVFGKWFVKRGISDLEDGVSNFFQSYNLGNDRMRQLYTAMSGDEIQQAPFWARFKQSVSRRNKAVHEGQTYGRSEAEDSVAVANEYIAHIANLANAK